MDYDLNKPAFGPGAEIVEPKSEPVKEPENATPPSVEPPEKPVEEPVTPVEENKVPYSRFKNVHQRALEAEAEAERYRAEVEALRSRPQPVEEVELPPYWVKMYGDSEESKEAWKIQKQVNEELKEETKREALEAVRGEKQAEEKRVNENIETIDNQLESLSAYVGRDLTDKEQSDLLDIIDEFTPQDEEGNYLGATIPFEKAWEIYELKNKAQLAPKKAERDSIAALTGSPSVGDPNIAADKNKDWNPLDWNSYKKRI